MINEKAVTRISKFLSLVLRHQPNTIGISLDENGWTDVLTLIDKMNAAGFAIDRNILGHVVSTNNKKRFAFDEAGDKIRASQGHSVEIELGYAPAKPPAVLYHGTGEKSVPSILQTGIEKRERQHVHLSADKNTAVKVGQRHGKPFVFMVWAEKMWDDGHIFYLSQNGVWLTDHVPATYLAPYNNEDTTTK